MMRSLALTILFVILSAAAPALAQDPPAQPAPPPESPIAGECRELVETDRRFRAQVKNLVRLDIHEEDANLMLRNKRHVVISYGVLWALAVVFLVLLYLRQRSLLAEIARLETEVARAAAVEEEE